ncbi:MAG: hypothetical protein AAF943_14575 [Pseudomonadota bacterium]
MAKENKPASESNDAKKPTASEAAKGSAAAKAVETKQDKSKDAASTAPKTAPATSATKDDVKTTSEPKADAKPTENKTVSTSTPPAKAPKPDEKAKSATPPGADKQVSTPKQAPATVSKPPVKPVPTAAPAKAPEEEKKRGVFGPVVFGGILAAVFGYGAAELNFLNTRPDLEAMENRLIEQIQSQKALIDAQQAEIEAFEQADLTGVETGISDLASRLDTVAERITVLEDRPVVVTEEGTEVGPPPELLREIDDLRASVDELLGLQASVAGLSASVAEQLGQVETQNSEISQLLADAQSAEEATAKAAQEAAVQAAVAQLTAAFSSGAPFSEILGDLNAAGVNDLPEALTDTAADGVTTLLSLQTDFPDAARASLSAARETGVDAGTGGVAGFLRRQLGARSVTPQEGDSPNAILSRAEAAVRSGDVSIALQELSGLPEDVSSAMSAWLAQARERAAAEAAVQDLSQRLATN